MKFLGLGISIADITKFGGNICSKEICTSFKLGHDPVKTVAGHAFLGGLRGGSVV